MGMDLRKVFDPKENRHAGQIVEGRNCVSIKDELKLIVEGTVTTFLHLNRQCF